MASAARRRAVSRRDKKEVAASVAAGNVSGRRTFSPYKTSKGARPVVADTEEGEGIAHGEAEASERKGEEKNWKRM